MHTLTDAQLDERQYPPVYLVNREQFRDAARLMKQSGARLAVEWAADETAFDRGFGVYACYERRFTVQGSRFAEVRSQNAECGRQEAGYVIVKTYVPLDDPTFPSLTKKFHAAYRFERQLNSLMGVVPVEHPDLRPWIKHEDWPVDAYPLRKSFDASQTMNRVKGKYSWARVEGEGVYEIPVGPVHAGIIEPGHFRFHAVGEDVINLEVKLGYVHKGIEKRFESLSWEEGVRLAGRVSGDSTVGHSLAYCRAVESMAACQPPERALWLRALMLERERIANHLGDIGAIANDVAFAFMLYQLSTIKERLLRTNHLLFCHRFMMDVIVPGGVAIDITRKGIEAILTEMDWLSVEFERLVVILDRNSSLNERLIGTGILSPDKAAELGVVGFVARASGQSMDARVASPFSPYDRIILKVTVLEAGDVYSRIWVRIGEIRDSIRIIREVLNSLPEGEIAGKFNRPLPDRTGFAAVEGWRGEIIYWLQSGPAAEINRCMIRDPSSINWSGLEEAIHGNIVPDFPVCNKSFNQSYSGADL